MATDFSSANQFVDNGKNLLQLFVSKQVQAKLFSVKVIFILISLFLIGGIFYFLFKSSYLKVSTETITDYNDYKKGLGLSKWQKKWKRIKGNLEEKTEDGLKVTLIEGERMIDQILIEAGYQGHTMEERLSLLDEKAISNLDDLRLAHKICRDISSDPDYKLDLDKAKKIIEIFETSLKDLQIL